MESFDEFKEFEKYQMREYRSSRHASVSCDGSDLNIKIRSTNNRASFKSEHANRSHRKQMKRLARHTALMKLGDFDSSSLDDTSDDDSRKQLELAKDFNKLSKPTKTGDALPKRMTQRRASASPHSHHRSKSCRVRSRRARDRQFQKREEVMRRTSSVPTRSNHPSIRNKGDETEDDDAFYVVRSFSTSNKGIINRGDSLKKRKLSSQSSSEGPDTDLSTQRLRSTPSQDSSYGSVDYPEMLIDPHTILVIGNSGVGKSTLIRQFMTSEYIGNGETCIEEGTLPCVSVLLDDAESTLEFVDITSAKDLTVDCAADAFIVVFAVSDRYSFDDAINCLQTLHKLDPVARKATILVANKGDIVRGRDVEAEEAKVVAVHFGCKYIEVSAIINMKVDELLAGILKQIRLKNHGKEKTEKESTRSCLAKNGGCIPKSRRIVKRIFSKYPLSFKSCDNLLV